MIIALLLGLGRWRLVGGGAGGRLVDGFVRRRGEIGGARAGVDFFGVVRLFRFIGRSGVGIGGLVMRWLWALAGGDHPGDVVDEFLARLELLVFILVER